MTARNLCWSYSRFRRYAIETHQLCVSAFGSITRSMTALSGTRRGTTIAPHFVGSAWSQRPMTPARMDRWEIRSARARLGLSTAGLAKALRLGKDGGRTVRRWEAGDTPISGTAQVAIELMLERL